MPGKGLDVKVLVGAGEALERVTEAPGIFCGQLADLARGASAVLELHARGGLSVGVEVSEHVCV